MSDIAQATIIGRLTNDPELRYTQSGASVAGFSLALNNTFMRDGTKVEETSFLQCVAWGKVGEAIAQYCKKGHRLGVHGRILQRRWDDQSGNKRSTVEIVVEKFQFLQPREGVAQDPQGPQEPQGSPFSDEDIPF